MAKHVSTFLLILGCIAMLMTGFSSCSSSSHSRSTAHIKKHSGFGPGKGKAKSPKQRIKSAKR